MQSAADTRRVQILFAVLALILAAFTVWIQVSDMPADFLTNNQLARHDDVLYGQPLYHQWKYRILSEWVVEAGIQAGAPLGLPYQTVFILARFLQNVAIFALAAVWFRRLGTSVHVTLIGLVLVAWAMTQALYNSDLSFNTYSDVLFYLIAALLIAQRKFIWIIPLTLLASLNRETSGLIPLLLIGSQLQLRPFRLERRTLLIGIAALALWAAMQLLLRQIYGWTPGHGMTFIGLPLLQYNMSSLAARNLFLTLNLVPFLAVCRLRRAPALLQRFFWTLVPLWFVIHFVAAAVAETRLFLVPYIVVLVPMALSGLAEQPVASPQSQYD